MHSIYDWFSRHRFAVDFVLMGVLLLMAVPLSIIDGGYTESVSDIVVSGLFALALIVPLAWRRTRTVVAGFVIAVVAILQWSFFIQPVMADVAVPLIVYALAAFAPRWASLGGLGLALLGSIMLVTRYFYDLTRVSLADLPYSIVLILMVWVLILFSWTAGDLTRTKRLREQALSDRAHRLEIEAQHERELAASDERAHIAREMHDIVAHSLSVIITQADGARYAAAANPDIAPATLSTIAATGRTSLQEMRRLLGVLRGGDEASTRPLPGLGDLDELLLGIRATGLPVDYTVTGTARRQLPGGAELTAYRVVQEGLTNVIKHAGPTVQAIVTLAWNARGLAITVHDNGRGATAALSTNSLPTGHPLPTSSPLSPGTLSPRPLAVGATETGSTVATDAVPQVSTKSPPLSARVRDDVVPHQSAHPTTGGLKSVQAAMASRSQVPVRPATVRPAAGDGNGLRGMSERVKLYDGTFSAGPLSGGGFGISVFIPYTEH